MVNEERRTMKENPVQRRRRVQLRWRLRQILRTIARSTKGRSLIRYFRVAHVAAGLNRRLRKRVAYPWLARPYDPRENPQVRRQVAGQRPGRARRVAWALDPSARVPRGRPRREAQ